MIGALAVAAARQARKRPLLLKLTALAVLAVTGLMVMVTIGITALIFGIQPAAAQAPGYGPSGTALADIPGETLAIYREAGEKYGLDWAILAAIGKIETDHGRSTAAGVHSGVNFAGCCAGPMQFSIIGAGGGTWGAYGNGGDVYSLQDAIPAAARYLKASGAPADWHAAIFAYNHAEWYVADVLAQAAKYRAALENAPVQVGEGQLRAGMTPKEIIDQIVLPIAASVGIRKTVAQNDIDNANHSMNTTSGNRSDHKGPPDVAWAADMSNGVTTPQEDALADALAKYFGIPWTGSGVAAITRGGYRYQILYRTLVGGNHFNHVHMGVHVA